MDLVQQMKDVRAARSIGEVNICNIEGDPVVLIGTDGHRYVEISTNIWKDELAGEDVLYVGTSRHGGHITLRPLFILVDGVWRNSSTGAECRHPAVLSLGQTPLGENGAAVEKATRQRDWRQRCLALVEICESYSWTVDLESTYRHICNGVTHVLNCKESQIISYSVSGIELLGSVYRTDGANTFRWEGPFGPEGSKRLSWIVDVRTPLVLDAHDDDAPELLTNGVAQGETECLVVIPLLVNDKSIGACISFFENAVELDGEDEEFLVYVGRALGAFVKRVMDSRGAIDLILLDERKRLAREIHDNVVSYVGSLSLNAAAISASFEDDDLESARRDIERLEHTTSQIMSLIGSEVQSLDMSLERADGFLEGVRETLRNFEAAWGIQAELDASKLKGSELLGLMVTLQLSRILNACLSNVLKHSRADMVKVEIIQTDWCLSMVVTDNGVGFDVDALDEDAPGFGAMHRRAQAAGGQLSVFSGEDGTSVHVDLPFKKAKA